MYFAAVCIAKLRGLVKLKKNQKIREKLGSGWVGQAPTRISSFFGNIVFFCVVFLRCTCFPKKYGKWIDWWVGGHCLDNSSFSRIFGIYLT